MSLISAWKQYGGLNWRKSYSKAPNVRPQLSVLECFQAPITLHRAVIRVELSLPAEESVKTGESEPGWFRLNDHHRDGNESIRISSCEFY